MQMESWVKFCGTENFSLASQQNSITAFSLTTKYMGTENNWERQYNKMPPNSFTKSPETLVQNWLEKMLHPVESKKKKLHCSC